MQHSIVIHTNSLSSKFTGFAKDTCEISKKNPQFDNKFNSPAYWDKSAREHLSVVREGLNS